jgi:hypothetical protein
MILSCILLRKMDSVVVSGFGAVAGLGRLGEIWALAKDAKTETDTKPTGTRARAMDRNIKNPPRSPGGGDATGINEVGGEKFGGGQIFPGIEEGGRATGFDS